MRIFLSVGSTYNDEQEAFVSAFETFLSQNKCERLTVGRGSYFSKQPIESARDLMKEADGMVVIAFTRQIIESAREKPDSELETKVENEKHPTVWNQLESAMGFGLDLPLLMVIEKGLRQEAMLKDRLEYRALVTSLDPNYFSSDEFKGIFADWKTTSLNKKTTKEENVSVDIDSFTIGHIFKTLKPSQLWGVSSGLLAVIAAFCTATYWVTTNIINKVP